MILVTGGTGLVGSHLLYYLLQNNSSVKAIYRDKHRLKAVEKLFNLLDENHRHLTEQIEWVKADLNDIPSLEQAFTNITHVYHCAAFISFDSKDYQTMRKVNIEGTSNIVNLCVTNAIKKLCFVSSIAAVEKSKTKNLTSEDEPWNSDGNKSGYSITKYGAEMEVWRASQEGVPVVIVNPGVILGSGFWQQGSGALFSKIDREFPFYTEGVTGFIDVIDVVKIMIQLMQSNIQNERFILVGHNLSFKVLFFKMADFFNKKRPYIKVTPWLGGLVWRLDYLKSRLFNKPALVTKNSIRSSLSIDKYSADKIKKTLGYSFNSIDTTLKRITTDYRNTTTI